MTKDLDALAAEIEATFRADHAYCLVLPENMCALLAEREKMKAALEGITKVAGNRSDEALMTKTGGNDAASRGIMVVSAREIAFAALKETTNDDG